MASLKNNAQAMTDEQGAPAITEYHVVYVTDPEPRREVQYGKRRPGYQAWDKRVATSAAQELAKQHRPSKVIIHDRTGGIRSCQQGRNWVSLEEFQIPSRQPIRRRAWVR
jgi:hypothetical protein